MQTHVRIFESSQLEGLYVGDLLYQVHIRRYDWKGKNYTLEATQILTQEDTEGFEQRNAVIRTLGPVRVGESELRK